MTEQWTEECEELLAEWSEKASHVIDGYMVEVKRSIIEHGIIVFLYL